MHVEYAVGEVTSYEVGRPDSLVVVIPKAVRRMLGITKGTRFNVKVDGASKIIYERISEPGGR